MTRRFLAALAASLCLATVSCSPKVMASAVTDSEVYREIVRDTSVTVPTVRTSISAAVRVDRNGDVGLRDVKVLEGSPRVKTQIDIKDNRLNVRTVVDSMQVYLTYKERYSEKVHSETVTVTETKEVNILKWHQECLIWVGIIALCYVAGRVIWKFYGTKISGFLNVILKVFEKFKK